MYELHFVNDLGSPQNFWTGVRFQGHQVREEHTGSGGHKCRLNYLDLSRMDSLLNDESLLISSCDATDETNLPGESELPPILALFF